MLGSAGFCAVEVAFHVSRAMRDRYEFDESLFSLQGDVIFANFRAARLFAQKVNQRRDVARVPEQALQPSHFHALGLLHELSHYLLRSYLQRTNPQMLAEALDALERAIGAELLDATLLRFVDEFPPVLVYRGEVTAQEYLQGTTQGVAHRQVVLEEVLMLWLSNTNPAFAPFRELFDDSVLAQETAYTQVIAELEVFFAARPGLGALQVPGMTGHESVIDLLRAPARAVPHSLEEQLAYVRTHWGFLLSSYIYRLLGSLDMIREEHRPHFIGPGPVEVPNYAESGLVVEPEQFTPDRAWMPRLVLIAKNAYVWLDQLSRVYRRPIERLDQVPDEELARLARWGVTGLWLIGLWERSQASQRIKQLCGNPDAMASAYSLFDYQIAGALGGAAACAALGERARLRGIRLASDMVPNHVGIDGRWVIEHPDWFVAASECPFPSYTFDGPDISSVARVGLFLEDHYYNQRDAAVVFKRVDRGSGAVQYIYHGNDGTSMPWNDTAQLNYLNPAVREAVIQTILHVARLFPIIRFDAAMTLAKRHYQRLWFPEPGTGASIASRAEYAMTKAQFDALMPQEFWREVVDRAAVEAPDTLLLAEAFWLMEGYFVRSLGMHRVYNSAFMNVLRDEENAKYRLILRNTLEFDPEILKRYVNFMNNPDERTAVEQFGKGDKYFGICTLMVTMPGLPMFGHGQFEGFTEKYGMEYKRAYTDEYPDASVIQRHEYQISPLLYRRYLFAGVDEFLLYDGVTSSGVVNEDVFAYSNCCGDERALVVYHNKFAATRVRLYRSVAYSVKTGEDDARRLVQRSLGEGLVLHADPCFFTIFRDSISGLEYVHSSATLVAQGLELELGAYAAYVFLDVREVQDTEDGQYAALVAYLGGRGVASVESALTEVFLQPVLQPFQALVSPYLIQRLVALCVPWAEVVELIAEPLAGTAVAQVAPVVPGVAPATPAALPVLDTALMDAFEQRMQHLLHAICGFIGRTDGEAPASVVDAASDSFDAASPRDESADDDRAGVCDVVVRGSAQVAPPDPAAQLARSLRQQLEQVVLLAMLDQRLGANVPAACAAVFRGLRAVLDTPVAWAGLCAWVCVHALGGIVDGAAPDEQSRSWLDEWFFGRTIAEMLRAVGASDEEAARGVLLITCLTSHQRWFAQFDEGTLDQQVDVLMRDPDVQVLLGFNRFAGIVWFNKQAFEQFLWHLVVVAVVMLAADVQYDEAQRAALIATWAAPVERLQRAAEESGYQVQRFLEIVGLFTPELQAPD